MVFFSTNFWAYTFEGAYNRGGLYSRFYGISFKERRAHSKRFSHIYQVNVVDLGSLCSFSKKTKISFISLERPPIKGC